MLSIYPNFLSTFDQVDIPFEETWRDLAQMLGNPLPRGPHKESIKKLIAPLESALDGKVVLERGRFYISSAAGKVEAYLLAEGLRKIGTLAQLVVNDTLTSNSTLFWDEPEANLNPELIRLVAKTIVGLVNQGMQVFIATHSLFLLRQLYILSPNEHLENAFKYFSLHTPEEKSVSVQIEEGHSLTEMKHIASLDYQIEQDEKLMQLFANGTI